MKITFENEAEHRAFFQHAIRPLITLGLRLKQQNNPEGQLILDEADRLSIPWYRWHQEHNLKPMGQSEFSTQNYMGLAVAQASPSALRELIQICSTA